MAPRRYRSEKRGAAVEDTRRRIIEATLALHTEQGILATSFEDIARRADVAVATVYRHYPALEDLVQACGQLIYTQLRPPEAADAPALFAGVEPLAERVARLVHEWFALYERGSAVLETVQREKHLLDKVRAFDQMLRQSRAAYVQEALRPISPDPETVQVVGALTDFLMYRSLQVQGASGEVAENIVRRLILSWLEKASAFSNES